MLGFLIYFTNLSYQPSYDNRRGLIVRYCVMARLGLNKVGWASYMMLIHVAESADSLQMRLRIPRGGRDPGDKVCRRYTILHGNANPGTG